MLDDNSRRSRGGDHCKRNVGPASAVEHPATTVFVTGGAGFVDSSLVERLLGEGHDVHVVDNLSTGSLENLMEAGSERVSSRCSFHHVDIRSPELVDLIAQSKGRKFRAYATEPPGDGGLRRL